MRSSTASSMDVAPPSDDENPAVISKFNDEDGVYVLTEGEIIRKGGLGALLYRNLFSIIAALLLIGLAFALGTAIGESNEIGAIAAASTAAAVILLVGAFKLARYIFDRYSTGRGIWVTTWNVFFFPVYSIGMHVVACLRSAL